jgi:hypothetical protein
MDDEFRCYGYLLPVSARFQSCTGRQSHQFRNTYAIHAWSWIDDLQDLSVSRIINRNAAYIRDYSLTISAQQADCLLKVSNG